MTAQLQEILSSADLDFFQTNSQRHAELGNDIAAAALTRPDARTPGQRLLDRDLFETKPTILRRVASLLCESVPEGVERLAGAGADAIILTALSLECGIPFLLVHQPPESTGPGTRGIRVAGEYHPGERALLLAGVITTGAGAASVATAVRAEGMRVDSVLAVVDQEQKAAESLAAHGLSLESLFTSTFLFQGER